MNTRKQPHCCHINEETQLGCPDPATQEVLYGSAPHEYTHLCDVHTAEFWRDIGPYATIYPIEEANA